MTARRLLAAAVLPLAAAMTLVASTPWLRAFPPGVILPILLLASVISVPPRCNSFRLWRAARSFRPAFVTPLFYRVIRHPLYLGEAVMLAGIALQYLSLMALMLMALQFVFQLQRIVKAAVHLFGDVHRRSDPHTQQTASKRMAFNRALGHIQGERHRRDHFRERY